MIDFNHKEVFDHLGLFILPRLFMGDVLRRFYENIIRRSTGKFQEIKTAVFSKMRYRELKS